MNPELRPQVPDYELLKKIGGGSYGEVWLARNVLGDLRAVKVVYRRNFEHDRPYEREFEGIKKFEPISRLHESQVDILHVGRNDQEGYFYYVMELADDAYSLTPNLNHNPNHPESDRKSYIPKTLKWMLHDRRRLPPAECIEIGLALARALENLHSHGLVHRDIKPSNIIFIGGVAKLADIGLVASMDATMSFVGTSGFLPPEGPGTPQADIYSLGKVLYEMSTGKERHEFPELPEDLRDLPDRDALIEFNAVLVKACAIDTSQRYQTAEELRADLALLERGESVRSKRVTEHRFSIARKIAGAAGVVVALLLGALLFVNRFQHHKTPNPEAARLYELGRWHQEQFTDEHIKKAIEYLNQAIQIDPKYVPAYTALFRIYEWSPQGVSEQEKDQKVKQIAAKLVSLAPDLPESHVALSWSKYREGDWRGAEEELQRALQLNPNYAQAHRMYCYYLSLLGRIEEAKAHGKRAQELDPTSRNAATVAGYPFVTACQYDLAIAQFRKALELDRHFARAHMWIAKCYEAQSNYPAAIDAFETCDLLSGEDSANVAQRYDALRQALANSGEKGYWLKVLQFDQADEAVPEEQKKVTQHDRWFLPGIYARLGQTEKALDLLEKEVAENGGNDWLKFEPLFHGLRDEPRFKELLKKSGLEK